ncbi:hypothetical protein OUZ56_020192 [Daphnia magna]|uniref:Uncharacterized protein n=1 Tax=Daphnia magna TaxID=35525 RepID=A0ABQ9ZDS3_9CRUS|nr:hypothetical protein OUZ56_020192 [Daphnia magna]
MNHPIRLEKTLILLIVLCKNETSLMDECGGNKKSDANVPSNLGKTKEMGFVFLLLSVLVAASQQSLDLILDDNSFSNDAVSSVDVGNDDIWWRRYLNSTTVTKTVDIAGRRRVTRD